MMMPDKDELIKAQNELIGVLFEIVKRLNENNTLDEEYFALITSSSRKDAGRIQQILDKRKENSGIVSRLLSQLEE